MAEEHRHIKTLLRLRKAEMPERAEYLRTAPALAIHQGIAYPAGLEAVVIDKLERWGALHLDHCGLTILFSMRTGTSQTYLKSFAAWTRLRTLSNL